MRAWTDKSSYAPGEIMVVHVAYDGPAPVEGYFTVKGMGMEWHTKPLRDLQSPTYVDIPVQIPYCTVRPGTTVTGWPIECPPNAPASGMQEFVVEIVGSRGVIDRARFSVNIMGEALPAPPSALSETPNEGPKGIPWWLIAGAGILLLGGGQK